MSVKESAYDLQSDMKTYLLSLYDESIRFASSYVYTEIDHNCDDVVYLRNRHDSVTGRQDGLYSMYTMQKNKIKEQKTLRPNAQNYIKKYYADDLLKEIECFVEGRLDCRFIAVYRDNKRYLIPFSETGTHYPTYTYILETHDNYYEEYMVSNSQIVYRRYTQLEENKYAYLYINYIPKGTYPINAIETGIFNVESQISYLREQYYSWYEEFDAKRKNKPYCLSDIPFVVDIST